MKRNNVLLKGYIFQEEMIQIFTRKEKTLENI